MPAYATADKFQVKGFYEKLQEPWEHHTRRKVAGESRDDLVARLRGERGERAAAARSVRHSAIANGRPSADTVTTSSLDDVVSTQHPR